MRVSRSILIMAISTLVICALSISVFAESRVQNNFSFSVQGCAYTPPVAKFDSTGYATICCTATDIIKVTICDFNHKPVSRTITISGKSDIQYKIEYFNLTFKGDSYCLKICSDNYYTNVSGCWTP